MEEETKRYTRKEIAARNSKKDAAFVIDNQVYDVTKFLDDHPGGHEVLVDAAGEDATQRFDDIGHSSDAKEIMKKYRIGEVVLEDKIEHNKTSAGWTDNNIQRECDRGPFDSWKMPVILAILMTLLYNYIFV